MNYLFEVIILLLLFVFYGCMHSILASIRIKKLLKNYIGNYIAFYRLFFNLVAIFGLYLIWEFGPHPSLLIYALSYPYDIIVFVLQFVSLIGMIWCFRFICFQEFIGLSQINRFVRKELDENDLDEKMTFRVEGPYKFSRHPLYSFSILFLLLRSEMNLFYLTMFISFIVYFYIGSIYEEKKLVKIIGFEYEEYQKKVSRFFPFKALSNFSDSKSVKEVI